MKEDAHSSTNTYCPRLWHEVYIDEKGDVFSCCHAQPAVLGNIYQNHLREIYNNALIKRLRAQSLLGQLACYNSCSILNLNESEKNVNKIIKGFRYERLKRLKICFGRICNINCIMCHRNRQNDKILDTAVLIKHVDIGPFERIDIQGGEPLLIEQAKRFFSYAVKKGKKAVFLTNGTLLSEVWMKKIVLHSPHIHISINAATKKTHEKINRGSRWETVIKNIQFMRKWKQKYKKKFNILGHMTITRQNIQEVPLFIQNLKKLGFDAVNFSIDTSIVPYLKNTSQQRISLFSEIEKALRGADNRTKIQTYRMELIILKLLGNIGREGRIIN